MLDSRMGKKKTKKISVPIEIKNFINDTKKLCAIPTPEKHEKLHLAEYPFDLQLLNSSRLYRESRQLYYAIGGTFSPTICSTLRGLSAQDLFKDEIAFSPSWSEILWFKDFYHEATDPLLEIESLALFNGIALFHEQNHRIIWRLLPPSASGQQEVCRYLNFAESLVVSLDLALGDEIGEKQSQIFERMKVIYRAGKNSKWLKKSKAHYRQYLLALTVATYYILEMVHEEDILNALNYVLPHQKESNKDAVPRSLEISELFTRITNPLWQERYWQKAEANLQIMHAKSSQKPHFFPEDPLELGPELAIANRVFDYYGI